jgi:hypothetical protein
MRFILTRFALHLQLDTGQYGEREKRHSGLTAKGLYTPEERFLRMARVALPVFLTLILLGSCSKSSGGGQHATVQLRDGTSVSGKIVSSSASDVQIAGDDNVTRTLPMTQVRSIVYDDSAAAASGTPPPAAPAEPEPRHAEHYHPRESAVTTKRFELPAGAEVAVRTEETIDSGKAVEGQTFAAEVTRDMRDESGDVVIPHGSNAQIVIVSAAKW